jgi:Tfp pilus assembly protein PilN
VIRINLLPAESRAGSRLPAKVLATAFGSALAVSACLGWLGLVYFGDLGAAEAALAAAESKLAERAKKVVYVEQLEANKKDYALRVQTIQDIGKSRRVWSKFLDELIDVVNNNGDTERHLAWFNGITVRNDAKAGAKVEMQCSVQGNEQYRLANFHDDLEAAPFGKEVTRSDPNWDLEEDSVRIPPHSLRFALTLQFKPTVVETKKKPAPAPAPAPAGK